MATESADVQASMEQTSAHCGANSVRCYLNVHCLDVQGTTMLHFSAQQGSASMVTWLLKAGANPDARDGQVCDRLMTNSMHEARCHCRGTTYCICIYVHASRCVFTIALNVGKQLTYERPDIVLHICC